MPGLEGIRKPYKHGIEQFAGPSGQTLGRAVQAANALARSPFRDPAFTRGEMRAIRHFMPLATLSYTRALTDRLIFHIDHSGPNQRAARRKPAKAGSSGRKVSITF